MAGPSYVYYVDSSNNKAQVLYKTLYFAALLHELSDHQSRLSFVLALNVTKLYKAFTTVRLPYDTQNWIHEE